MIKRLGVLGGMGPAASAEFYSRLTNQTPAACDQDHLQIVIWSDPSVPDRSTSLLLGDDRPWPKLEAGILGLKAAGCDHIIIPCNTAHLWYDRMLDLGVPITHIVDSVAAELVPLDIKTVGILGTQGTIATGLYQNMLSKQGWHCIIPTEIELTKFVQPGINLVKAGNISAAHDMFIPAIDHLINHGAQAIVLGCTEIPLAVTENSYKNIPLINSIDSLVKAALKL
jgi:aspartate racemase